MTYLGEVVGRKIPLKSSVHVHPFARQLPKCFDLFSQGSYRPAVFSDEMAYKGIFKYDFVPPALDDVAFRVSFKDYCNLIRDTYLHPCATPSRIAAERPDGSSGVYHKKRKRDLLTAPGSELAIRSFASIADLLMAIFVSFLKDEMRNVEKDTRQVNGGPLPHWILEAIMMLLSEEAIENHPLFAVGSTPFYGGWHELITRVLPFKTHAASDVKMMDSHMHPRFMEADAEFFRSCHNSVCTDCVDAHDYVFDATLNTPMVMHNGAIWQKHAGHNSGGRCTCGRNSRYMLWLFCYGSALLKWPGSVTDHVTPLIYGDDNICGSNRSVQDLTKLFDAMSTVGHVIKYEFGAVHDLPFLSFKSHLHTDGRYYPVPHDRIRFASHVVCGASDDPQVIECKLNSLRLLSYFDTEIYTELTSYMASAGMLCYDKDFLTAIMFPTKEARREGWSLPRGTSPGRALEQLAQNIMASKSKKVSVTIAPASQPVQVSRPRSKSSSSSSSSAAPPPPARDGNRGSKPQAKPAPPSGTTLVPCKMGQALTMQRMDPRTLADAKSDFYVPPTYGTEAGHFVAKYDVDAKFADYEGRPSCIYMQMQRTKRSFATTAGVVRVLPIAASNTPNVFSFAHVPNGSGSLPDSMWSPLHTANFAVLGTRIPGSAFLGWPLNFSVTQASGAVKLKFTAPGALGHALSMRWTTYDAAGGALNNGQADIDNNATITVNITQAFTAGTQYYLRVWAFNNQPATGEFPTIMGELYSDTASNVVFPNIATCLDVVDIPVAAHSDPNSLVDAATVWVQNMSSNMFNGGSLVAARVPAGWYPRPSQNLYASLAQLAYDEFDGPVKNGSYVWNNQSEVFYRPVPNADMRYDANYNIGLIQVPDGTEASMRLKCTWSVFHSGGDAVYGYEAPVSCPSWMEVNRICADARAVTSNDNHVPYIQKFVSGLKHFLLRPDVRDAATKVVKILGPLAAGLIF